MEARTSVDFSGSPRAPTATYERRSRYFTRVPARIDLAEHSCISTGVCILSDKVGKACLHVQAHIQLDPRYHQPNPISTVAWPPNLNREGQLHHRDQIWQL
jgi:hypothetical protein